MHPLLDPQLRPVIGHRGNRAHAPENTIESLMQALSLGVDALEFDIHVSRDGVPVLMHDPTLERTTSGRGKVIDYDLTELRGVDAGANFTGDGGRSFPYRGRGIQVPTLAEALEATGDIPLIVEIKSLESALPSLKVLREVAPRRPILIGSFLDDALLPFRQEGIPTSAGSNALTRLYFSAALGFKRRKLPYDSICTPRFHNGIPVPVKGYARIMKSLGRTTHVWTVNSPQIAQKLWTIGVNGIISDDPGLIIKKKNRE